jgi:hypothetical protein
LLGRIEGQVYFVWEAVDHEPTSLYKEFDSVADFHFQERVLLEEKVMQTRAVNTELFNQSANFLFARVHSLQLG